MLRFKGLGWESVLRHISGPLSIVLVVTFLMYLLFHFVGWKWLNISAVPLQVVGAALSIYLGFINNSAYDRYWEARTLWGGIINQSRNFARQVLTMTFIYRGTTLDDPEADVPSAMVSFRREMVHRQIAYAHILRCALMEQSFTEDVSPFLKPAEIKRLEQEQNSAAGCLYQMAERLRVGRLRGWLDEFSYITLQGTLSELTNLQGGCERIKNTPIPLAYTFLTHNIVTIYCCALPFGLVEMGPMVFAVVLPIAVVFLALDRVGQLIQQPFGDRPNDLDLDALTRTIEINLLQQLGEKDLPEALEPIEGVLN